MSLVWTLDRGAQLKSDNSVRFSVWAPRLRAPIVRVCTGPAIGDYPLTPVENEPGLFSATVPDVGAGADYVFVSGDGRELPDPVSRSQPNGVHGPSRVIDPTTREWTDIWWRGVPIDELVIYELHVGTFTPEGTFTAIIPRLAELKALGVTAIELMPIAQFPGERNWGYDGVDLYAPQNTYGGPDGFAALVDAAHDVGLGVILDVVYNHVGPEGNYLDAFGPYFAEKYTTPWGRALNYGDADSEDVRRFVIDNALYWITEFHVDGLRIDAAHRIFDLGARHVLAELAAEVHDQAARLDRTVALIAESDLNDAKLLRPPSEYGYGLDGQWADDFHHAVHATLTGERNGYYADFGPVSFIVQALREPFVFDGQYSMSRRRRHGGTSVGIPRTRFVVAIQNHDQIGNRAAGERLTTILRPEQLRFAAALLLLSPYVPLLFMGEEYGETNPFQYFISHGDASLAAAVRDGRRAEFSAFEWSEAVPDAADPETFTRSKLDWSKLTEERHAQTLALHRDLIALRRDEPMLRPDGARILVEEGDRGWFSILREPSFDYTRPGPYEGDRVVSLFNCSPQDIDVSIPGDGDRSWTLRLSTDAASYGGADRIVSHVEALPFDDAPKRLLAAPRRQTVHLPPWSAATFSSL
ncbi:MAG TPA: malto-oligosyltrehalose trehalohydrolase [Gemmatimonadaceae bacterium]